MGGIVSAVVGGALAVFLAFGLVTTQTGTPAPVDAPYIVYGNS